VAVEVALKVEVGEQLTILDSQEALELGIRGDVVLVLEVVVLHVGGNGLSDIGPGLLGAIREAQEGAQLGRKTSGYLKDGKLAGGSLLTLHRLLGLSATLVSLLLKLSHALLQALELRHQGTHRLTNGAGLGQHSLHIILYGHDRSLGSLHGGSHHTGGSGHGGRGCHGGSLLLSGLLGGSCRGSGHGGRGCHGGDNLLLLRNLLGLLCSGGGSRAHYT